MATTRLQQVPWMRSASACCAGGGGGPIRGREEAANTQAVWTGTSKIHAWSHLSTHLLVQLLAHRQHMYRGGLRVVAQQCQPLWRKAQQAQQLVGVGREST